MTSWSECKAFFHQFRTQYRNTGSILPSACGLARALASPLRKGYGQRRVLEVGPGTGAVTVEILRALRAGDQLDIVEINEHFIRYLQRRFEDEPLFRSRRDQVRLIHAPLQEVPGEGCYDYLISGLPLNNFPLALVREIFHAYQRLLRPGGVLSYFEYLMIRHVKALCVGRKQRRRLRVLGRYLQRKIDAYQFREQWVFLNVPPAVARHLRFGPDATNTL
jgi:phospholipid N-methyltransferase